VNNHYGYTDPEAEWVVPGAVGPAACRAYSNAWPGAIDSTGYSFHVRWLRAN